MDTRNNLPLSCNLIIAFAILVYPPGQTGTSSDEAKQIGTKDPSTQTGADSELSPDRHVSITDNRMLYAGSTKDLECLALNIYFEARSESKLGRRAVGHVVMNRVNHGDFPHSICAVVRQGGSRTLYRCQFSWWCDGQSDKPYNRTQWLKAVKLAFQIFYGHSKDPTGGALWYHADYTNPNWSRLFKRGPKIGRHIFYRESLQKTNVL